MTASVTVASDLLPSLIIAILRDGRYHPVGRPVHLCVCGHTSRTAAHTARHIPPHHPPARLLEPVHKVRNPRRGRRRRSLPVLWRIPDDLWELIRVPPSLRGVGSALPFRSG